MPELREEIKTFLRNEFIFTGLDEERLEHLASEFQLLSYADEQTIYTEGEEAKGFFIVYSGIVRTSSGRGSEQHSHSTFIPGDIFGTGVLMSTVRDETAYAMGPAKVLRLPDDSFQQMLKDFEGIRIVLLAIAESRRLARRQRLKWIGENEAVYLVYRKHEFFLWMTLILPIFAGVASIPFLVFGWASPTTTVTSTIQIITGIFLMFFAVFGFLWFYVDWHNDYYIVTSQRVLWLEKVIALYDSRQEAPLTTVLSTQIVFNQVLHSFINYGHVIVRTYTGSITMRRANRPSLLVQIIDGLRARSRFLAKQAEAEAMEALIRKRLGLPEEEKPKVSVITELPPPPKPEKPRGVNRMFANFLKVRYEIGDVITYRKHWFVLFQKTWLPTVVGLGVSFLAFIMWFGGILPGLANILWLPILLGIFIWWLYNYIDWRNDVYVLTLESVLDIERKPLAREDKKAAPLSNILSLEHTREGILGILFNYGTVTINVGTTQLTFDTVVNPAQVQYEIFDRMYALRRRNEEAAAQKERERLADWLVTYHRQAEKLGG